MNSSSYQGTDHGCPHAPDQGTPASRCGCSAAPQIAPPLPPLRDHINTELLDKKARKRQEEKSKQNESAMELDQAPTINNDNNSNNANSEGNDYTAKYKLTLVKSEEREVNPESQMDVNKSKSQKEEEKLMFNEWSSFRELATFLLKLDDLGILTRMISKM